MKHPHPTPHPRNPGSLEPRSHSLEPRSHSLEPISAGLTSETLLTAALEHTPEVHIPESFAARVAARAAALPRPRRSPWLGFGPRIAAISGVVLTGALFACAPHTASSFGDLRFDLELLLLTELGSVGYLLVRVGLRD